MMGRMAAGLRGTWAEDRRPFGRWSLDHRTFGARRYWLEWQTMRLTAHAEQHGYREDEVDPRGLGGDFAGGGLLIVGGRHDAQNLLLVRPDEHPYVEQHD